MKHYEAKILFISIFIRLNLTFFPQHFYLFTTLNPSKTEFLWTATKMCQSLFLDKTPLLKFDCNAAPKNCAKLLGVHLDADLSHKFQINKTVQVSFTFDK